jgi:cyanate permease
MGRRVLLHDQSVRCGPVEDSRRSRLTRHDQDREEMDAQSSGRTTRQTRPTTGVLAVMAILLVAINWWPGIVSVGPLLPSIINDFRLSDTAVSLLVSIPDVLRGAAALPTPWLARRFGRDAVILSALFVWKAFVLTVVY